MAFSNSDQSDLNKAILEYLYQKGYKDTHDMFIEETGIDPSEEPSSRRNILETKWRSVAKLKKQNMQL
jgi:hypothetical protein